MSSRKFRYMFHSVSCGSLFTVSAWNLVGEECLNMIYMGGSNHDMMGTPDRELKAEAKAMVKEKIPFGVFDHADFAVLSNFDVPHIKHFLELLLTVPVAVVYYPIVAPEERQKSIEKIEYLRLMDKAKYEMDADALVDYDEMLQFLQHPYYYLTKRYKTMKICPVYGNGQIFEGGMEDAVVMDPISQGDMLLIRRAEGYEIPAVRAGYIVKNKMLFQFGSYGETLSLFISPLNNGPAYDDCQFQVKNTGCNGECETLSAATAGRCSTYCLFKNDWDVCKKHSRPDTKFHINGVLLPGVLPWADYGEAFMERFASFLPKARIIQVPGNGQAGYWNKKWAKMVTNGHRRFWVGSNKINEKILRDIVCMNGDHRYMKVDDKNGICTMGIITPLNEWES